ncbi:ABC transporter related protein [Methanospirillum hungatei JF-1]|jgi:NitT/TauT family transport system ATP-binding protein|uniref:Molybdate/tungstate import ATP-binding protein WtpC n=1 Tax=Methanospirillum hungatei JF-1 (strain ATCC 27890 / DSM 864 / NBRC 100397 / JF-1) TaxID=323259 RepID=Q2FLD4_METHJ|nr:ABC transporter ATP-binding protein [Methanospirillum hungatei]MBP7034896.1 ABC transporter ATP-binding protein [Methanospirillum sp.]OQA55113.1 MAG: Trehalose/maltose import ATP-binding protein MalK [Euryarchaeota archaeon ADurb.Bin294]ABD39865.1 ABC transporter related protein [Methanospirillum hungatei JF-1]MBP9008822.1 ABC transporter ATP-binding protein [Methanospirillum sp.]HOW04592.1 ABC transporter ATP-binding protein [Methanospirillum hungatei]
MGRVEISHISREFIKEDGDRVVALSDINLSIADDEFVSFVGPSGCGKTTLLRIIAGLDKASSGEVRVDGSLITGPGQKVGMVFQEYSLFPWRSVLSNVAFGLQMRGIPKEERQEIARKYISLVGLSQFEQSFPYELSGGMRQRVAIARALATDPDLLLMDEPFGALDAQTRNHMQCELLDIWETKKKTILFVTHSCDEAVFLSDRVVVLSPRPGVIREIINIPISRPRDRTNKEFIDLRRCLLEMIDEEEREEERIKCKSGNL